MVSVDRPAIPNWLYSFEPQHRMPPPTNRAHDASPCVDTSTTPQGPSGDGVMEGLLVIDAVRLRVAVDVEVEVAVRVRVAVDVIEPVAVAVIDTEAVKEGVLVRVGVPDGVTEDVMEMVGDGVALAEDAPVDVLPERDAVTDGDLLADALAAGVVLRLTEGEAEHGENSTSVAAGDVYCVVSPRPSWPLPPFPQHRTPPDTNTAQECVPPHATSTADEPEKLIAVAGGALKLRALPLPSCPLVPCPQHFTVPPERATHVCWPPADTRSTIPPVTAALVGVLRSLV